MYSDIVLKISAMIFDLFSKDNMHLCKYLLVQNQPFRLYFIGILFSKTFSAECWPTWFCNNSQKNQNIMNAGSKAAIKFHEVSHLLR